MHRLTWPVLLLGFVLLLAACGSRSNSITIKIENMAFDRSEVRVKAGQPVTLKVVNEDGYAHAFDVDAFAIHAPLPAKAVFDTTFTPSAPGSYRFYCSSPGHEAAGMAGVLVVEP